MKMNQLLNTLAKDCEYMLDVLNIPYVKPTAYILNTRAKNRWGQCHRDGCGEFTININSALCDGKHNDGLMDTILHELIHTCPNCMNHGKEWKGYAEKVNKAYGYNISRCSSAESKGFDATYKEIKTKYHFVCTDCGQEIHRQRKSRFTENYKLYRCGICGGSFEKR